MPGSRDMQRTTTTSILAVRSKLFAVDHGRAGMNPTWNGNTTQILVLQTSLSWCSSSLVELEVDNPRFAHVAKEHIVPLVRFQNTVVEGFAAPGSALNTYNARCNNKNTSKVRRINKGRSRKEGASRGMWATTCIP